MTADIYAIAAVFTGSGSEDQVLLALCRAAEQELTARLRPGLTPEDCRESFVCAAALLAASHFGSGRTAGGIRSFAVGSVSVSAGGESQTSEDLRTQAMLLMRPFCRGEFSFVGVRG